MDEYLILINKVTVGNSALWWRPNHLGKTTDPYEAGVYTKAEAQRICGFGDYTFIPKAEVLHLAEHHVDCGKLFEYRHNKEETIV